MNSGVSDYSPPFFNFHFLQPLDFSEQPTNVHLILSGAHGCGVFADLLGYALFNFFNHPLPPYSPPWLHHSRTVILSHSNLPIYALMIYSSR
jgi:hypothetical protein